MMNSNDHLKNSRIRLPVWLRKKAQDTRQTLSIKKMLKDMQLHTVCQSAGCPNLTECFQKPTAAFMILGNICTRGCRFCGVESGKPEAVDPEEPKRIAEAVTTLNLKHVVITSVTRDDLKDGGAAHYAETIQAISLASPDSTIEALVPDFTGDWSSLKTVLDSNLDILNHNVETIPELYEEIRPGAEFNRSLELLKMVKVFRLNMLSKSGLMLGLGESRDKLKEVFDALCDAGCDILTMGQYLAPSRNHYPVQEFITPEQFDIYAEDAKTAGIPFVYAGPFIRSSYNAAELMQQVQKEVV